MAAKIVVTDFEPWEHGAENPTLEVLKQLDSANDIGGDLTLVRLPVDSNRIGEITSRTVDEVRPDLWISLGLAPGRAVVAIERITANVMDFPVPDNASTQYGGKPVFSDSRPLGDVAGQTDRRTVAGGRYSRQDFKFALDLSVQSDDVHGALSHRQERNEGARRLHPCSGPSQPRGDSELSAGRNAVDER